MKIFLVHFYVYVLSIHNITFVRSLKAWFHNLMHFEGILKSQILQYVASFVVSASTVKGLTLPNANTPYHNQHMFEIIPVC